MKNNPDYFPNLNLTFLKEVLAKRWVQEFPIISRITLHHYNGEEPYKYAVICEIPSDFKVEPREYENYDDTIPTDHRQQIAEQLKAIEEEEYDCIELGIIDYGYKNREELYRRFVFQEKFRNISSNNVYRKPEHVPENFGDEWFFYPKTSDEKWPNFALKEPYWQLYPDIIGSIEDEAILRETFVPNAENYFIREGNVWRVKFQKEVASLPHYDYMRIVATFLNNPGKPIKAIELTAHVIEKNKVSEAKYIQDGLSMGRLYREYDDISVRKIEYLNHLVAEKERETDPLIKQELQEEIDKLEYELTRKQTKKRKSIDDPHQKKSQKAISKALKRAYNAFRRAGLTTLSKYLEENIKPCGRYDFVYVNEEIRWYIKT